MAERAVSTGDILTAELPLTVPPGHEQTGKRPVLAVAVPGGHVRYRIVVVVPLTTQGGDWVSRNPTLYPTLHPGSGHLHRVSVALLDQIRGLDVGRITGYIGSLTVDEYEPIRRGLSTLLKL